MFLILWKSSIWRNFFFPAPILPGGRCKLQVSRAVGEGNPLLPFLAGHSRTSSFPPWISPSLVAFLKPFYRALLLKSGCSYFAPGLSAPMAMSRIDLFFFWLCLVVMLFPPWLVRCYWNPTHPVCCLPVPCVSPRFCVRCFEAFPY